MINESKKQTIKLIVSISILVLLFLFVIIMMIQYEVEGEKNMPFTLSKIVMIGTVEGTEKTQENEEQVKWDFNIEQNNDIYFYIDQNENYKNKEELIKSVKIDHIQIIKAPEKGIIQTYMPNSKEGRLFIDDTQFLVDEKLEYKGAAQSSTTNLEIGSKGGTVLVRFCNNNIGSYTSDEEKQIIHNSSLLQKIEVNNEQIEFSVSFDFTIETTKTKYKAPITLNFPTGNLDEEENCHFEKTDMSDVIFKRAK